MFRELSEEDKKKVVKILKVRANGSLQVDYEAFFSSDKGRALLDKESASAITIRANAMTGKQ